MRPHARGQRERSRNPNRCVFRGPSSTLSCDSRPIIGSWCNPSPRQKACAIIDAWFAAPAVETLEPGPRYWTILRSLVVTGTIRAAMVSDAHLAALAIEHDATLYSADRDFRRFAGLRVINPLV
jgi:predicted nucleic acid-binding protein